MEFEEIEQEIRDHLDEFLKNKGIHEPVFLVNSLLTLTSDRKLPSHLSIGEELPMALLLGEESGRLYCFSVNAIIANKKE
jgi:hypothetical protein